LRSDSQRAALTSALGSGVAGDPDTDGINPSARWNDVSIRRIGGRGERSWLAELCDFGTPNLDAGGGFHADADLASPDIDHGDFDSRFDENAFANFAIKYEHLFLPEFHLECENLDPEQPHFEEPISMSQQRRKPSNSR